MASTWQDTWPDQVTLLQHAQQTSLTDQVRVPFPVELIYDLGALLNTKSPGAGIKKRQFAISEKVQYCPRR